MDEKTSIPTLFSNAKPKAVAAYLKSKQLLPFGFAYGNLGLYDICQASLHPRVDPHVAHVSGPVTELCKLAILNAAQQKSVPYLYYYQRSIYTSVGLTFQWRLSECNKCLSATSTVHVLSQIKTDISTLKARKFFCENHGDQRVFFYFE